ncbi:MAG: PDZ domain-containing protein [bacterium]|nr:PDZ domain-containing protein [bacterium]
MGVVSAPTRLFTRAIQTDANTSPANYGGPLIDVHGPILGISVPLSPSGRDVGVDWYDSGIGFCSTIADITDLIERMQEGEILHRAWMGIQIAPEFLGPGARVHAVIPKSPAETVGLKRGDTILEIDKEEVKNSFHLQMLLSSKMAGDPIHLIYQRRRQDPVGITVFLVEVPQKERKAQSQKEETFTPPWKEGDPSGKK